MRRLFVFLGISLWVSVCSPAFGYDDLVLPSVEFTATAVHEAGVMKAWETLHYANGKLRIDRGSGFSSTILDLKTQTECLLMVNQINLVMPMDDGYSAATSLGLSTSAVREKWGRNASRVWRPRNMPSATMASWMPPDLLVDANRSNGAARYYDGLFGHNQHHLEFMTHITFGKTAGDVVRNSCGIKPVK